MNNLPETEQPAKGAEELRRAVALLDNMRESFNDSHTTAELLQLCRVYRACEWDIAPDRWTPDQLSAALQGVVPRWDEDGRPVEQGASEGYA